MAMTAAWVPWHSVRDDRDVVIKREELPDALGGALYWPAGDWAIILIDKTRPRRVRKALLGHELLHHARGGSPAYPGMPPMWRDLVARDEGAVRWELARRMVPRDELVRVVDVVNELGEGWMAWEVGEFFDCPDEVAADAVKMLEDEWSE